MFISVKPTIAKKRVVSTDVISLEAALNQLKEE